MRSCLSFVAIAVLLVVAACGSRDPQTQKRDYVASGDRYAAQKKYPEAIIQYRNAIAVDARFGEARLKLADAYQKSEDAANAFREYVRAADLMPDNLQAQMKAANFLLLARMYPEAQARANAALAVDPNNAEALIVLGNALANLNDLDGGIKRLEDAVDKEPQLTLGYANLGWLSAKKGDLAAAEGAFKRAVDVNPKSLAAHLNLANFYWASRRSTDAEREMKAAVALAPRSAEANQLLAAFYINSGRREAGEPYLKAFAGMSPDADAKLTLADFYLADGRTVDAVAVLEPLQKDQKAFGPATLRLAVVHFNAGQKPKAYGEIEEVLKQSPTDELAMFVKARLLVADRRFSEALPIADAAIQRNPSLVRMHYMRAASLRPLGRIDEAIAAMKTALQLMPSSTAAQGFLGELYLDRRDGKGALELATQLARTTPRSPAAHYLLARALLESGDANAAEREFLSLAGGSVPEADLQTWLGRTYLAKNDKAKARRAFVRARELDPQSLLALNGLVTLNVLDANREEVKALIEEQLARDPKNAALLFLSGNTYMALGDSNKAEAMFQDVLKLTPDNFDAYLKLGTLYAQTGRLDEAKKRFEAAALDTDRAVPALTFLGMVLEQQKNPAEARKQYEKALALNPRAAVAANNLAWLYADSSENLDVALQLAQTAKSVLPENASVNHTLGWVYYKKGLFPQAVAAFKESVNRQPDDAAKQYYLGLAYIKNQQVPEGRHALERALKQNPTFSHAADARQVLAGLKS